MFEQERISVKHELKPMTAAEPRRPNRYLNCVDDQAIDSTANKLTDLSFEHKLLGAGALPDVDHIINHNGINSSTPTPKTIVKLGPTSHPQPLH